MLLILSNKITFLCWLFFQQLISPLLQQILANNKVLTLKIASTINRSTVISWLLYKLLQLFNQPPIIFNSKTNFFSFFIQIFFRAIFHIHFRLTKQLQLLIKASHLLKKRML